MDTKSGPLAPYILYVPTPHTHVGGRRVTSARLTQCHTAVCSLWLQFALKYLPIALWGPDRGNDPGQWRWWERLGTAVGQPSKKKQNKKTSTSCASLPTCHVLLSKTSQNSHLIWCLPRKKRCKSGIKSQKKIMCGDWCFLQSFLFWCCVTSSTGGKCKGGAAILH